MIDFSLAEIAEIVGGKLTAAADPQARVTGNVEFDSRRIEPGGLFFALPGERVDGTEFISAALANGAVAAVTARDVDAPAIIVPPVAESPSNAMALAADTDGSGAAVLAALGALGRAHVDRLVADHGLTVIGVTGSAGKTSTKDLIAAVLETAGTVIAPPGSFNNEIGHPWTALRADTNTDFLVLEMSARAPGNIAALAQVAPPRIGVVLNVGTAHLGEFGSREIIAQTKGELVAALPAEGLAILNADDDAVLAMQQRTVAQSILVGRSQKASLRAEDVDVDDMARARFTLIHEPNPAADGPSCDEVSAQELNSAEVRLQVHGEHQVSNALAAAAVGLACGLSLEGVAGALSQARARSARRMDVRDRADGVTVINDSYNANPDSVRAALRSLAGMARSGAQIRRTWAVLGEMAELGDDTIREHDAIGRFLVRLNISQLLVVGKGRPQRAMFQGAIQEGSWGSEAEHVASPEEALDILKQHLAPGDIVLVKASAAVGLWVVAESLLEDS